MHYFQNPEPDESPQNTPEENPERVKPEFPDDRREKGETPDLPNIG